MDHAGESTYSSRPGPDSDARNESHLLEKLRSGDDEAFEILVRTYGGRLLTVARRLMRDDAAARDAVQDGFLMAFRSLHAFKGEARISTWLHRIVVNACLMKLRTRRRKPEEPIEPFLPVFSEGGEHLAPVLPWAERPDTVYMRRENRQIVRKCIDKLPESYRTVLLLRDIEELDTEEASRALGISTSAVKIRLHRARQALRTLLTPYFSENVSSDIRGF